MQTALVLAAFRRPDHLRAVVEAVAAYGWDGPVVLHVDAPRDGHPDDGPRGEACVEVGRVALAHLDLEVVRPEANLGVGGGVPNAVDHGLRRAEAVVVLEDDVVPGPDFLGFATELLRRHRDDHQIASINGCTLDLSFDFGEADYGVGHLAHPWGWATWGRAWSHYVNSLAGKERAIDLAVARTPLGLRERSTLRKRFRSVRPERPYTWDYQWQFWVLQQRAGVLVPDRNLVRNIGHGPESHHTPNPNALGARLVAHPHPPPWRAPDDLRPARDVTKANASRMMPPHPLAERVAWRVERLRGALRGGRG